MILKLLGIYGVLYRLLETTTDMGWFAMQTLRAMFISGTRSSRLSLLFPQLYSVGTRSVPAVMLVGLFVGAVLGVEMFSQLQMIGQETLLGGIISLSMVKQMGPVLAAVMIAGRVGGAISAELGTMRVTDQVNALRAIGVDPFGYLVVPRVVACTVMVPLVTVFGDAFGVIGGYVVCVIGLGVDAGGYWHQAELMVAGYDIFVGIFKGVFFGLLIGLLSCHKGFSCGRGAAGVGRAATDAFVQSFIAIMIINFFLAKLLNDLALMLEIPMGSAI